MKTASLSYTPKSKSKVITSLQSLKQTRFPVQNNKKSHSKDRTLHYSLVFFPLLLCFLLLDMQVVRESEYLTTMLQRITTFFNPRNTSKLLLASTSFKGIGKTPFSTYPYNVHYVFAHLTDRRGRGYALAEKEVHA